MEETKKTEDSANGDPVDINPSAGVVVINENIDAREESGKIDPSIDSVKDTVDEPKNALSEPSTENVDVQEHNIIKHNCSIDTIATEEVQSKNSISSKELGESPIESVSMAETATQAETIDPGATEVEAKLNDSTPTTLEQVSQKVSMEDSSNSLKEEFKKPMDIAAVDSEQVMEVEEQTAAIAAVTVPVQEQIATEQQIESEAIKSIANSSLSMLSQYSGSSDSEADESDAGSVAATKEVASSSSSDDSDVEISNDIPIGGGYRVQLDPVLVSDAETMDTNAASSEDEDDRIPTGPIRTAGEILPHELPHIEELTITVPETECKPIGHIDSIVAQIVLVQSVVGAELLNLDTVLFLERGKRALGKIFDVIGQVNQPIYCILFNSNQEVLSRNIELGAEVYCAPRTEYTSFIILSELMRTKGSDASWKNDNEIPAYLAEHSDDEAERSAKKNRKKGVRNNQPMQGGDERLEFAEDQSSSVNPRQRHNYHQQQFPYSSRPQFQRPPPNGGRNFNPRYPSGHSWHHNYTNPRYGNPQQYQQRFPQRNQQFQQMPYSQTPPPQGSQFLLNPFAAQPSSRPPPPSGPN
ncbi:H/ACA ribonucleoprotein complex non-core subunit NAF1 [Anopheles nili]|uniref:H/ACA ribonucleoprotein complex non-core subunit NAF1 n=1 Tax=Anopheles nili TaxID=185578 RepID=UPI00237A1F49|nr:H/ACA ribonucleoprotein complex non-core subunit NAF1 [Anopheles nili]